MLFEQLPVGARRRRELTAGDAGHDLAKDSGVIFRLMLILDPLDAEFDQVFAQAGQRPLVQEAGDVIGAVGQELATPDADEEFEELAFDLGLFYVLSGLGQPDSPPGDRCECPVKRQKKNCSSAA